MTKETPLQLNFVDKAKTDILTWAKSVDIKLHNVETIVPFVHTDKSLAVWLFFDDDLSVQTYNKNDITDHVKQKYLDILKNGNYPKDYLTKVSFTIDSHENVVKNFGGNYFFRLR